MIILCVPAYNEEASIGLLLERIDRAALEIKRQIFVLVVNDGSTDSTRQIVLEQSSKSRVQVRLVDHPENSGLGAAIRTGLMAAVEIAGSDDDVIATMDADNTHDPLLLDRIAEVIESGADLVIASRYRKGGKEIGLSFKRKILSKGAGCLLKIFFPVKNARDYSSGFRGYRASLLKKGFEKWGKNLVESNGFSCMAELLVKLSSIKMKNRMNARVEEVPLVLRYDLKSGKSKMPVMATVSQYFRLILKNIFRA